MTFGAEPPSLRVLLAEDDAALAAIVLEAIEDAGHVVTHAASRDEARRLASAGTWDVVVLDAFGSSYTEPGPDDRATVHELACHAPVVLTSGRTWATRAAASDLGAATIIPKPYDLEDLLSAILRAGETVRRAA